MKTSKNLLAVILISALDYAGITATNAAISVINPSKDNTLYEYDPAEGDHSNGAGFHFFAGKTGMGELRRGVLAFDIVGSIPTGSTITGVSLSMNMSRAPISVAYPVELHKLLADWGEGTSQAPGEEGDGAPATTNDATWRHRFFDTIFWAAEGGDFSATVSASQSVSVVGPYTWSSPQMVVDVQDWLDNPAGNFGWLVLGDEKPTLTSKRFDTRESASPPVLTIQYTTSSKSDPDSRGHVPSPPARPHELLGRLASVKQYASERFIRACGWRRRYCDRDSFDECSESNCNSSEPNIHSCGFLASPAFSARKYERKCFGRHRRRMRADPGWALHRHVDLWRDLPWPNNP